MAKLMDMDAGAMSLMLRGRRKMTSEEAHRVGELLGVKTTEVLRQAGIDVRDDINNVPISAWVDQNGVVTLFPDRTHDIAVGPADCPRGTFGVQCRATGLQQDGWLLFVSPTQHEPATMLEKACLVALTTGASCIATLRRGYRTGTFNLISWPANNTQNDANVAWCSPVLWIKP